MQSTIVVTLRLPPVLVDRVVEFAAREGSSQNATYIRLLADGLDLTPDELIALLPPNPPRRTRKALLARGA